MQNLRTFEVSYLSATNTKGTRLKIKDLRAESFWIKKQVTLYKDYKYNSIEAQVIEFLEKKGIKILWASEAKNKTLIIVDNFDIDII